MVPLLIHVLTVYLVSLPVINGYQHPSLDNLENERQHLHLIDPQLIVRRLSRLLKRPYIQQAYSEAALGYDSIKHWKCLEGSEFTRSHKWRLQLREGTQYFLPMDCEREDWRWQAYGRGHPPLFYSYVCMRACHWMDLSTCLCLVLSSMTCTGLCSVLNTTQQLLA